MSIFKSKFVKDLGVALAALGVGAFIMYHASKPLGDLYDKVVVQNYAAKSVVNFMDRTYPIKIRY
jgi:hypothetical protein